MARLQLFVLVTVLLTACGDAPSAPDAAAEDAAASDAGGTRCAAPMPRLECFDGWPECCAQGPIAAAVCRDDETWGCPAFTSDHCDCEVADAGP